MSYRMEDYYSPYMNVIGGYRNAARRSGPSTKDKLKLLEKAVEETQKLCASYAQDPEMTPSRLEINSQSEWSRLNEMITRVMDDIKCQWNTHVIARQGFGGGLKRAWSC